MNTQTGKIAFGGVLVALGVGCMLLTNVVPIATYALPVLAGLSIMLAVIELDKRWAMMIYAATAMVAMLLVTDVEAKLIYLMFFGYYPVLKSIFESLHRPHFCAALKFAVFNLTVIAAYYVAIGLFDVPLSEFTLFGVQLPLLFLLLGNIVFWLMDIAMTRLATAYVMMYHERVRKLFHLPEQPPKTKTK